jgi:hypothetical protein
MQKNKCKVSPRIKGRLRGERENFYVKTGKIATVFCIPEFEDKLHPGSEKMPNEIDHKQ